MTQFKSMCNSLIIIVAVLSISSSYCMEKDDDDASSFNAKIPIKKLQVSHHPVTPFLCFGIGKAPSAVTINCKRSLLVRNTVFDIFNFNNSPEVFNVDFIKKLHSSIRQCRVFCQDSGHPATSLFKNQESIINPLKFKDLKSLSDIKKASKISFQDFVVSLKGSSALVERSDPDAIDTYLMISLIKGDYDQKEISSLTKKLKKFKRNEIADYYTRNFEISNVLGSDPWIQNMNALGNSSKVTRALKMKPSLPQIVNLETLEIFRKDSSTNDSYAEFIREYAGVDLNNSESECLTISTLESSHS